MQMHISLNWDDFIGTEFKGKIGSIMRNMNENQEVGIMKVNPTNRAELIERFFIKCGSLEDESKIAFFIQPAFQPKTGEYYASVTLTKMESNLDLYKVFITGNDDSSYTKHYISLDSALEDIRMIKDFGINHIEDEENGFFFTN